MQPSCYTVPEGVHAKLFLPALQARVSAAGSLFPLHSLSRSYHIRIFTKSVCLLQDPSQHC